MSKKLLDEKSKFLPDRPDDYYLRIIENSKDILYLIDAKTGKFEYVSPSTTDIGGFTSQEIIKMGMEGISERTHPDDLRMVEHKIRDVLAKGSLPENYNGYIEIRFKHKDGHYLWFGINRNFLTDGKGRIKAVVGNIRDITETKLLQEQLESALDNYKTLYNNARVALYRTRISDGKMLECNDFMAKLLGYKSRRQCLAQCYTTKYADPESRSEMIKLLKEKGQIDSFELKARRINGELLWMKVSSRIYPDKGYLEGAVRNITVHKILTQTEDEILALIMQGKSSKEMAFQLKRSPRTIEDHRAHIMRKLGVNNIVELTKKAAEFTIGQNQ
ncbi:MAG: PAS domain S-box protein [Sedimentisphaerales bacterium]